MKKIYSLLIIIFFCSYSFSQTETKLSIIGEAKKKALPDVAIVDIKITAKDKLESESYKKLIEMSNDVLKRLKELGFNEGQIKLFDFSIETEYKQDKGLSTKVGYSTSQNYSVKFPLDKIKILKTYNALFEKESDGTSVSFSTEASDSLKEKMQNELIETAIDNARFKANIIAKKTGYLISGIYNIGYKYYMDDYPEKVEITKFTSPKIVADYEPREEELSKLFSINEIEFNEEIKFIFLLKKNGK